MPRGKREQAEQIILKLREAEFELSRGKTVPEAAKKIGVTVRTAHEKSGLQASISGLRRRENPASNVESKRIGTFRQGSHPARTDPAVAPRDPLHSARRLPKSQRLTYPSGGFIVHRIRGS